MSGFSAEMGVRSEGINEAGEFELVTLPEATWALVVQVAHDLANAAVPSVCFSDLS